MVRRASRKWQSRGYPPPSPPPPAPLSLSLPRFRYSSHIGDLKTDTLVATIPGTCCHGVRFSTSWPGVRTRWESERESNTMICNLAEHTRAYPSLRYTRMLLGCSPASNHPNQTRRKPVSVASLFQNLSGTSPSGKASVSRAVDMGMAPCFARSGHTGDLKADTLATTSVLLRC